MANSRAWKFARLLNSDGKVKADKTELRDGAAFTGNVDFNQGADVTGDITVTGNVDGVDVSAFKSDYDSHNHDSRYVNVTGDTVTGNLSVSGSLTSGSNAVFHDGYHPNADKWTTARTLSLSGDASGSVSWDGSANATLSVTVANDSHSHSNYLDRNAYHESNLDTKYDADLFGWTPSTTGRPENYGQGISIVSSGNTHNNSSNWITQLGFGTAGNTAYFRTKVNAGGWGSWYKLWHTGNDGSGSGLDADLLDGVHASSFLRSDAADSGTTITLNQLNTNAIAKKTNGSPIVINSGQNASKGMRVYYDMDVYNTVNFTDASWNRQGYIHGSSGNLTLVPNGGSIIMDSGTSTTVNVACDDGGNAHIIAGGTNQGTGIVEVRQSSTHGGGIEYNGDNSPATSGAGADHITLFQRRSGTLYWTARNYVNNYDWQFRGNVTAYASDERLKENIQPITDAVAKVQQLNGVTYDWRDECESLGFMPSMKSETGVIAQNVQKVIPDAVTEAPFNSTSTEITGEERNYLTVDKEKIIPLLIEAIKEQQTQIDELKAKLEV
jgi:hypothetical protein